MLSTVLARSSLTATFVFSRCAMAGAFSNCQWRSTIPSLPAVIQVSLIRHHRSSPDSVWTWRPLITALISASVFLSVLYHSELFEVDFGFGMLSPARAYVFGG